MSLNYTLMVTGTPYGSHRSASALQFCQALVSQAHNLSMVFFYQDGVYNFNSDLSLSDGDQINLVNMWKDFSKKNKVALYFCIQSVLRRGLLKDQQSLQHDSDFLINDMFYICGLSSIIENLLLCDRFIQF